MSNKTLIIIGVIILILVIFYFWRKNKRTIGITGSGNGTSALTGTETGTGTISTGTGTGTIGTSTGTGSGTGTGTIIGNIQVSNINGAIVYNKGNTEMNPTNNNISYGTKNGYISTINFPYCNMQTQVCHPPTDFYQINTTDFLCKKDITII